MALTRIDSYLVDLDSLGGITFDDQAGTPTFKVDATTHRVGIRTSTPTSSLHIAGVGTTDPAGDDNRIRIGDYHWDNRYTTIHAKKLSSEWWLEQNSDDDDGVDLIFYKSRGVPGAETPVQLDDNVFRLTGRVYRQDSTNVGADMTTGDWGGDSLAQIAFDVDEITPTVAYGRIDFRTASQSRMMIKADGNVGIGTTTPGYTLDVNGDVNVASGSNYFINGTQISTANVTENASYLYYTDTRSRNAISVTDNGGDGSLSYDSGTGVITYTGPSASETRAHFSAGTGVSIASGQISIGQSVGSSDDVSFAGGVFSGNVGIGTTNPQAILDIYGTIADLKLTDPDTGSHTRIKQDYGTTEIINSHDSGSTRFKMGSSATEVLRIKADGNVGIGTTDPLKTFHVQGNVGTTGSIHIGDVNQTTNNLRDSQTTVDRVPKLQINSESGPGSSIGLISWHSANAGYYSPQLWFAKSNSSNNLVGTNTIVTDGTDLGAINFAGNDGTTFLNAASIRAEIDGTPVATSSMPGRLVFFTTPSGGKVPQERLRITSSGNVGIGTTNPNPGTNLHIANYTDNAKIRIESAGDTHRAGIEFFRESSAGVGKGAAGIWVESETGNSSGELHFGTANNASLQSFTSKMTLDTGGNVGIGTTNPSQKLHVIGNALIDGHISTAGSDLYLDNAAIITNDANGADFSDRTGSNIDHIWHSDTGGTGYGGVWHFVSDSSYKAVGSSRLQANGIWMTGSTHVNYIAGNVGIGTTNPLNKLHVNNGDATFSNNTYIAFNIYNDGTWRKLGTGNGAVVKHHSTHGLQFLTATDFGSAGDAAFINTSVTINNAGNVGIGTNTPAQKLHIQDSSIRLNDAVVGSILTGAITRDTASSVIVPPKRGGIVAITSFSDYPDFPQPPGVAMIYYDTGASPFVQVMSTVASSSISVTINSYTGNPLDYSNNVITFIFQTDSIIIVNRSDPNSSLRFQLTFL